MDLTTLFYVYAALLLAAAAALFITWRQNPDELATRSWFIGSCLGALGLFVIALYDTTRRYAWMDLAGNVIAWLGIASYYLGVRQFERRPRPLTTALSGGLVVAATVATVGTLGTDQGLLWRIVAGSGFVGGVSLGIFVDTVMTPTRRTAPKYFLGLYFLLYGAAHLTRGVWSWTPGDLASYPRGIDTAVFFVGILGAAAVALGFTMMTSDRLHERLRHQASIDPLTGVLNRRSFIETTTPVRARAARNGQPLAVAVLDLDHFKRINDTYGHRYGDQALRRLADVAVRTLRKEDIFARLGGEEFGVLFAGLNEDEVRAAVERLREALAEVTVASDRGTFSVTVSVGVSYEPQASLDLELALHRADRALYAAKDAGRDRTYLWHAEQGAARPSQAFGPVAVRRRHALESGTS